jgi:hypothetical protein
MLPRLLGPQLSKLSKFPRLLRYDVPLEEEVDRAPRTAEVSTYMHSSHYSNLCHYCAGIPPPLPRLIIRNQKLNKTQVGNVGMSVEQLTQNVEALVAGLAEELPKSWGNIARVQLHATRGRAFVVYTASKSMLAVFDRRTGEERAAREKQEKLLEDGYSS